MEPGAGVRLLAALYDVPDSAISCMDSWRDCIFCGFENGSVQKFQVHHGDAIHTTLLQTTTAPSKKHKIKQVAHSAAVPVLFVLQHRKLWVLNSDTLAHVRDISADVSTFAVSVKPRDSDTAPFVHTICCCLREERRVVVYEYTHDAAGGEGKLAKLPKEFLLPERVLSVVQCGGMLCVGMLREYSVISLINGDAKSLLALNGGEPAVTLHDTDAFLRLNNVLFVVPVKTMPQSSAQALRRTVPFEHEPQAFTVRHGMAFGFSATCCEAYSLYDDETVQRLPVIDCRFVSDRSHKDMIFCASKRKLWLMAMWDIKARLEDLVKRYKVDEALDLLHASRRPDLEAQLKVMCGFAHLRHGSAFDAMGFFNVLIDVREVLRYVPDLRPPKTANVPPDAEYLHPSVYAALAHDTREVDTAFWSQWSQHALSDPGIVSLSAEWASDFDKLPAAADAARRVWNGAEMTRDKYIAFMWLRLRAELATWLDNRRRNDDASVHEQRAAEYALLVIYLDANDTVALHALLSSLLGLPLRDCIELLLQRRQYRALYAVLLREGLADAAETLFAAKLSLDKCLTAGKAARPASLLPADVQQAGSRPSGAQTAPQRAAATHELFFAADGCNIAHMTALLGRDPDVVRVTDQAGATALHVVLGVAVVGPSKQPTLREQCSAAALLVRAGCDGAARTDGGLAAAEVPMLVETLPVTSRVMLAGAVSASMSLQRFPLVA